LNSFLHNPLLRQSKLILKTANRETARNTIIFGDRIGTPIKEKHTFFGRPPIPSTINIYKIA
jgi:hypothetical protein